MCALGLLTSLNSFSRTLSFIVFFSLPLSALAFFLLFTFSISAFCSATHPLTIAASP